MQLKSTAGPSLGGRRHFTLCGYYSCPLRVNERHLVGRIGPNYVFNRLKADAISEDCERKNHPPHQLRRIAMTEIPSTTATTAARVPWNKGKIIGAKPPLRPKHVWSIRTKLQVEGRIRDLALFNLAIDSKLRGCDVIALKVEDVAPSGYSIDRATVRQKKTGQPVRFELTEQTDKRSMTT